MNDMPKLLITAATGLLICGIAGLAPAQEAKKKQERASPHETISTDVGGHKVTITYGRPYMKNRKIVGGLVPYGKVWRTGADEATTIQTDVDLDINGLKVPAGEYALFTLPNKDGWTLIINKTAKQWGAFNYVQADDLGRAPMQVSKSSSPVDQFTISLRPAESNSVTLKLEWENAVASATLKVVQ
jgi:hypothetical protein